MRADVEAFALFFFRHAQADGEVHHLEGDCGDDARPEDRDADRLGLDPHLAGDRVVVAGYIVP